MTLTLGQLQINGMSMLLIIGVLIAIGIIWNWQNDKTNQVDIKDLICTNGRISERKFIRFSTWIVSSWGFIYLIIDERFSEWYFAGYMGAWAGNALISKWLDARAPKVESSAEEAGDRKPGK